MPNLLPPLQSFSTALTRAFALPARANPEDQLKGPSAILVSDLGSILGLRVESQTEAQVEGLGGRPDMAVFVNGLLAGHIELKAPGLGADPTRLRGAQNKSQWEKFKALPNLIYTDGNSWALYRHGDRRGPAVRSSGDPAGDGPRAFTAEDANRLEPMFTEFLRWNPIVPHNSQALAAYLAPLARLLRDDVLETVENRGRLFRSFEISGPAYSSPMPTLDNLPTLTPKPLFTRFCWPD